MAILTVLLADDDDNYRSSIARYLRLLDCEVVEVDDGTTALEALPTRDFDLLISDIQMPQLNGIKLHHATRDANFTLPIILCSASPGSVDNAIDQGMDAILKEIGALGILESKVRRIQEAKKSQHSL